MSDGETTLWDGTALHARICRHFPTRKLTEIRRGGPNFVSWAESGFFNAMIPLDYPDGIGLACQGSEGSGSTPRVFDPPPLVATFGRSDPVPIFFRPARRAAPLEA